MIAKNSLLEQITSGFSGISVPVEEIVDRINYHFQIAQRFGERRYSGIPLRTKIAEAWFQQAIRMRVHTVSVQDKIGDSFRWGKTISHSFYVFGGGIEMLDYETRAKIRIAKALEIDGLPVMFKVKLSKYKGIAKGKGKSVVEVLRPENCMKIIKPLQDYLQTQDIGYVLAIHPEQINPDSTVQQEFAQQGGILVPFYATRPQFRQDVEEIKQRLKQNNPR